jgi:hypothetical protein
MAALQPTPTTLSSNSQILQLWSGGEESAYREKVQRGTLWCLANNLTLNTTKTMELMINSRKHCMDPAPLYVSRD